MSKAREPVKNQSFCNWFLFFHIFLRDVVMYKTQSSLSFFLSFFGASKQASKQTNKQTAGLVTATWRRRHCYVGPRSSTMTVGAPLSHALSA
jgi:hypothetical protein